MEDIDEAKILVEKVDMFSIKFPAEVEANSELTWFRAACGGYKMLIPKEGTSKTGQIHIYENALGAWELDGSIKDEAFHGIRSSFEEAIRVADEQVRKRVNTQTLKLRQARGAMAFQESEWGPDGNAQETIPAQEF